MHLRRGIRSARRRPRLGPLSRGAVSIPGMTPGGGPVLPCRRLRTFGPDPLSNGPLAHHGRPRREGPAGPPAARMREGMRPGGGTPAITLPGATGGAVGAGGVLFSSSPPDEGGRARWSIRSAPVATVRSSRIEMSAYLAGLVVERGGDFGWCIGTTLISMTTAGLLTSTVPSIAVTWLGGDDDDGDCGGLAGLDGDGVGGVGGWRDGSPPRSRCRRGGHDDRGAERGQSRIDDAALAGRRVGTVPSTVRFGNRWDPVDRGRVHGDQVVAPAGIATTSVDTAASGPSRWRGGRYA